MEEVNLTYVSIVLALIAAIPGIIAALNQFKKDKFLAVQEQEKLEQERIRLEVELSKEALDMIERMRMEVDNVNKRYSRMMEANEALVAQITRLKEKNESLETENLTLDQHIKELVEEIKLLKCRVAKLERERDSLLRGSELLVQQVTQNNLNPVWTPEEI